MEHGSVLSGELTYHYSTTIAAVVFHANTVSERKAIVRSLQCLALASHSKGSVDVAFQTPRPADYVCSSASTCGGITLQGERPSLAHHGSTEMEIRGPV